MTASPSDDNTVVVADGSSGETFQYDLNQDAALPDGWPRYVATTIRRLRKNFPEAAFSSRIAFTNDLPQASGISSSSALVISIAESLIALSGIDQTDLWRSTIRTPEDRATYFASIENGASFGALDGDTGVGTHGGSEDHAAIVMSVAGELRQFSFLPLRLERIVPMMPSWTFVVISSGVHARKGAEALGDYNRLAASASAIRSLWRERNPDDRRTLAELARAGHLLDFDLPAHLRTRLNQFIAEDARVADAADAFARGDGAAVGRLAELSQEDAERHLGNQVAETIDLVALARTNGAAAASAFGAGWGGSVWALVPSGDAEKWLDEWLRAYRSRHPDYPASGFVSPPGDGVRRWLT